MPSASMNRLMDNARVRLPGALDNTILAELFSVVNDFCSGSNVWRQQFEFEVLTRASSPVTAPDDFTYTLYPPTGARIVRLLGVIDEGNVPVRVQLIDPNSVFLDRSPSSDSTYQALAVLTVTDPVTRAGEPMVPDWIVGDFNDVLLDGVLARMMSQAAKPYSSPAMGALHYGMFKKGIADARIAKDSGNVYGQQNWSFPRNFRTRNRGR